MSGTQAAGGGARRGDERLDEDARQLEALGYKSHFSRRMSHVPWYQNYSVLLGTVVVLGVGLIYLLTARPADHLDVPAGDAIPRRG